MPGAGGVYAIAVAPAGQPTCRRASSRSVRPARDPTKSAGPKGGLGDGVRLDARRLRRATVALGGRADVGRWTASRAAEGGSLRREPYWARTVATTGEQDVAGVEPPKLLVSADGSTWDVARGGPLGRHLALAALDGRFYALLPECTAAECQRKGLALWSSADGAAWSRDASQPPIAGRPPGLHRRGHGSRGRSARRLRQLLRRAVRRAGLHGAGRPAADGDLSGRPGRLRSSRRLSDGPRADAPAGCRSPALVCRAPDRLAHRLRARCRHRPRHGPRHRPGRDRRRDRWRAATGPAGRRTARTSPTTAGRAATRASRGPSASRTSMPGAAGPSWDAPGDRAGHRSGSPSPSAGRSSTWATRGCVTSRAVPRPSCRAAGRSGRPPESG